MERINKPERVRLSELLSGDDAQDAINDEIGTILQGMGTDDRIRVTIHRIGVDGSEPQVDKFENVDMDNIPDLHEIGVKHGGGTYRAYIRYPKEGTKQGFGLKKKKFQLDESYNLERDKYEAAERAKLQLPGGESTDLKELMTLATFMKGDSRPQQNMGEIFAMMQKSQEQSMMMMMSLMQSMTTTVVAAMTSSKKERDPMMEVLLNATINRQDNAAAAQIEAAKQGMEMMKGFTQEDNKPAWMDFAESLVEKAPTILSSFIPASVAQSQLAANPEALAILEDPEKLKHTIGLICEKYDPQQAEEILAKLDLLDKAKSFGYFQSSARGVKVG